MLAASTLAACCLIAFVAFQFVNRPLWSDELLTTSLLKAASLPKLWSGAVLGIDGNPPLYLTAAWLIVRAIPHAVPLVVVLKLINLALTLAAIFALYRAGRRLVSASACWIGILLLATLNGNLVFVAFELRTYALYFLMAALAVLFQQRLIERPTSANLVMLALLYVGLTLAHTFGIAYVACIALAGGLSQVRHGPGFRPIAIAVAPAIVVLAAWTPFLLRQIEVGQPYSWIESPGMPELLETLSGSFWSMLIAVVELCCLTGTVIAGIRQGKFQPGVVIRDAGWQPFRYVTLLMIGMTGLVLAAWTISISLFPLLVPRYFVPQMLVSFALHAAFGEWLVRRRLQERITTLAIGAAIVPVMLLSAVTLFREQAHSRALCTDSKGDFFEAAFVRDDLPVIAESPHIFLPRAAYANHPSAYRFPLDWNVVLNYPHRARGNAVDFHIMQNLQTWGPMPSVMSTDDIVRSYPQFLVVEQPGRAWFHNLRATRNVVAEKLAETANAEGNASCTLWKVTSVQARGPRDRSAQNP
jgi:hypothetical protein